MAAEQLPLNYAPPPDDSARRAEVESQPLLFEFRPDIDVHLADADWAHATINGTEHERTAWWLAKIVSSLTQVRSRRYAFPARELDRLLCVAPPAKVTLDASCVAVGRALWAQALGWRPLRVTRDGQRLLAHSVRWPKGWRVVDVPWSAIAALERAGVPLEVEPRAKALLLRRLTDAGRPVAHAGLAGSAVRIDTDRPDLIEALELPGLAYAGPQGTGRYRLPILAADPLLREPLIEVPPDVERAIRKATSKTRAVTAPAGFPWELYAFQARDLGRGLRILEHTGGVLFAGEQGSGKTTVALAAAAHLDCWPLLVVAPLAAFSTWERQLGEMGRENLLAVGPPDEIKERIAAADWDALVVSYDRLHLFIPELEAAGLGAIIADEVQRIRTPTSRRSRALRALAGAVPLRIGLSGTPVTNKAEDVLPLGAFLVPGEWPPRLRASDLSEIYPGDEPIEALAEHLGTMMVRRRMDDTGVKLPGRHVSRVQVPLTPEQRRALHELEEEARAAKEAGELGGHMHVFARLQKMRQIVNVPAVAGVGGPNPKVAAAVELAIEYSEMGRKSVIFVADRPAWTEVGTALDKAGVGWTGIWGSTPVADRIGNEKKFHADDSIRVFVGTLAACAEALTLSPTATVTIFAALSYSPSAIAQAAARTFRMNQTNDVDEIYLHASAPGGTLDDRMHEILETKRQLISRVVDRTDHVDDAAKLTYADLVFMLTGERDGVADMVQADADAAAAETERRKAHARATLYRHKTGETLDGGETAVTREEWEASELERLEADLDDDGAWEELLEGS